MRIAETVQQQLKQAKEAVDQALSQAQAFAKDEIVQPLQQAAAKLDALHTRTDGAMDRWVHELEQSRYTAVIVIGAMLVIFAVGLGAGWASHVAFG